MSRQVIYQHIFVWQRKIFMNDNGVCIGGSYSNLMGMHLARFWKFPDIKEKGLRRLPRMVVFTSEHGHYSVTKNASLIGLPSDDVIKVKCDLRGRLCCDDLEQKIISLKEEVRILSVEEIVLKMYS